MIKITKEKKIEIEKHLSEILLSIKMINPNNVYVTGGAIYSLINNEVPNDYDIYFKEEKDLEEIHRKLSPIYPDLKYSKKNTKDGIHFVHKDNNIKDEKRGIEEISQCSITIKKDNKKIQLVTRVSGNINFIHSEFDFEHCKHYFSLKDGLVLNEKAPDNQKELIVSKDDCIFVTMETLRRLIKFSQRGFTISKEELQFLFLAIRNSTNCGDDLYY